LGSKRLESDLDHKPLTRRVLSRAYHGMTRLIFDVDFSDTTSVKAYKKSKVLDSMNWISTSSSSYETELVVEAGRRGLMIEEVPVEVKDDRLSREVLRKKIQR